jgi:PAS domain S-box-containing protein
MTRAEADYDRLFNLSLDLLCVAGLDGYFKRVNPSWTRVLGWSEAELLARPVEEFMHPEDRGRTLQARSELAKGVPVRGLENRYLCKDGSCRWLSWQSVLEPAASTVFAVARDVTERRQQDHEHLVLSKLESTGILAAGIAHDFNNLLAGLLLNVDLVSMSDGTTDEQEHHLQQARQAIVAARALTQQLITFAEGGAPVRRACDVKTLLTRTMNVGLTGSTINGQCELAKDLWRAELDEGQISQVFRNLILNAREAVPANGIIRLSAENAVIQAGSPEGCPAGHYVRITVTDNGTGIAPDILPKIFDPYFSTKQRGSQKGMGLGLTICRMVIKKHGGSITVERRSEGGTRVVCYLPAIAPAGQERTPTDTAAPAAKRILVMDDEPLFLEIMESMLRQLGYEVNVAAEGNRAVALYEQASKEGRPFDVVLLDLTIRGGMGGSETIGALRQKNPAVEAVLMTGYSHEPAFRDYARHGFKAALEKPFSAQALLTALKKDRLDSTTGPGPLAVRTT